MFIHKHAGIPAVNCADVNNYLVMSDAKSVIALLCKHLNLSIGCSLKPEYLRLAKYNKVDDEASRALWTVLHILSRQAVKHIEINIDFDRYAVLHATKLYLAFLQYPTIEFYAQSPKDESNRELLLALGWLLATKDVLDIVIRAQLTTSVLSQEYSRIDDSSEKAECYALPEDTRSHMRAIVHTCSRISHNLKEIGELVGEKIKLTTKIHAASLDACGLPHLSVSQVALTKNSLINGRANLPMRDERYIKELRSFSTVIDTHSQWTKSAGIFYDWMLTVIKENKNDDSSEEVDSVRCNELSNFLSLLRHVTKKKIHSMKTNEGGRSGEESTLHEEPCCSRFFRTQEQSTEAELWDSKMIERSNIVGSEVEKKMNELTSELRQMLRSIPNCVEI